MIQIGIIDPKAILAEALKEKVELSPDFTAEVIHDFSPERYSKEGRFNLVLADLSVVLSLEKSLNLSQSLPVLLTSSFVDVESQIQAYRIGAKGLVSKSYRPELLHRSIFQSIEGGMELSYSVRKELKIFSESPSFVQAMNEEEQSLIQIIVEGKSMETASLRLNRKKREIHQSLRRILSTMIGEIE
jgi:DNA-binding NarL/FixJ family response regulator